MLSGWIQLDQSDPLTFRKEVLYADEFEKRDKQGVLEYKFKITPDVLKHLELSAKELRNNGVEIPYASKHAGWELAENRWGEVIGALVGKNDKGKDALFLDVKFSDEETKKVGLRSNVSIGAPPLFVDGLGRKYTNPLRHLAATSAPVIPGLEPWKALAASFGDGEFESIIGDLAMPFGKKDDDDKSKPSGEEQNNSGQQQQNNGQQQNNQQNNGGNSAPGSAEPSVFDQILQVLELAVPANSDDKVKGAAILTALQMLKGRKQMAGQQQQVVNKPAPQAGGGIQLSQDNAPMVVDLIRQNRELQLSHLVTNEILDPNAAKELLNLFASKASIGIELSHGGDGAMFNKLIGILANNKPVKKSGRSEDGFDGSQELLLGHDGGKSGLSKMVDKRVEEHEKLYGKAG